MTTLVLYTPKSREVALNLMDACPNADGVTELDVSATELASAKEAAFNADKLILVAVCDADCYDTKPVWSYFLDEIRWKRKSGELILILGEECDLVRLPYALKSQAYFTIEETGDAWEYAFSKTEAAQADGRVTYAPNRDAVEAPKQFRFGEGKRITVPERPTVNDPSGITTAESHPSHPAGKPTPRVEVGHPSHPAGESSSRTESGHPSHPAGQPSLGDYEAKVGKADNPNDYVFGRDYGKSAEGNNKKNSAAPGCIIIAGFVVLILAVLIVAIVTAVRMDNWGFIDSVTVEGFFVPTLKNFRLAHTIFLSMTL